MPAVTLYNTLTGKWKTFATERAARVAMADSDVWVTHDQAPPDAFPDPPPPTVPKRASKTATAKTKTTKTSSDTEDGKED